MLPGLLAGLLQYTPPVAGPFAVSGTEREDGVLTITGGTPPYTVQRASDSSELASGLTSGGTYTIPATLVGDEIEILDSDVGYHLTAVIGSSALAWLSAADSAVGPGASIVNRGTGGANWDQGVTGSGITTVSDAEGAAVEFTGSGRLQGSGTVTCASSEYTVVALFDTPNGSTDSGTIFDFYQAGTARILLRHQSSSLRLFDSSYRDYAPPVTGAMELGVWRLNGTSGLGNRSLYHAAERTSEQGVTYNNRLTANVELAVGAFRGGTDEWTGKFRFLALYPGILSDVKVAEVRAALKRTWAHVDQTALEIPGLRVLCNAESGNVTERVLGPDIFAEDATDLSGNGNMLSQSTPAFQPLVITDPGGRWNGKRVLESDDGLRYLLKTAFDLGGASDEHAMGFAMEIIAYSSNARILCLAANSGQPRIYTPGSAGNTALQNGADTTFTGTSVPLEIPTSMVGTFESGVTQRGYRGGRLEDEDAPAATITWADGGDHSILAYIGGTLGLQMRVGEWFIARTAFTPTLALVHGCRHHVEYGTALA